MVWLFSLAIASETPEDPEWVARLESVGRQAILAPQGCFVLQGTLEVTADVGLLGTSTTRDQLRGKLRDGVWESREIARPDGTWRPAGYDAISAFGQIPGLPRNTGPMPFFLDTLPGQVSTVYAEPDGNDWRLIQTLQGKNNRLITSFNGEPLRARQWTFDVPNPIMLDDGRRMTKMRRMNGTLEVNEDGSPRAEIWTARFRQGIFVANVSSSVLWTAAPCPPDVPTSP